MNFNTFLLNKPLTHTCIQIMLGPSRPPPPSVRSCPGEGWVGILYSPAHGPAHLGAARSCSELLGAGAWRQTGRRASCSRNPRDLRWGGHGGGGGREGQREGEGGTGVGKTGDDPGYQIWNGGGRICSMCYFSVCKVWVSSKGGELIS